MLWYFSVMNFWYLGQTQFLPLITPDNWSKVPYTNTIPSHYPLQLSHVFTSVRNFTFMSLYSGANCLVYYLLLYRCQAEEFINGSYSLWSGGWKVYGNDWQGPSCYFLTRQKVGITWWERGSTQTQLSSSHKDTNVIMGLHTHHLIYLPPKGPIAIYHGRIDLGIIVWSIYVLWGRCVC